MVGITGVASDGARVLTKVPRPRRNRVTPCGQIEATPYRGTFMGNRGDLHAPDGTLGTRRWTTKTWVCCAADFRGRVSFDRQGTYTPLFFSDEAVALAAGHRPCGECRHKDLQHFKAAWKEAHGIPKTTFLSAREIDAVLHVARVDRQGQRTFHSALGNLPEGTYVTRLGQPERPMLIWGRQLRPWSHASLLPALPLAPNEPVAVLTPAPTVAVLRAGYVPAVRRDLLVALTTAGLEGTKWPAVS